MQRREKILLYGFLAVIVLWRGAPMVNRTLFGPLEERAAQLQTITAKAGQKEEQQVLLFRSMARLKEAKAESLPPNELDAQRQYQDWLTDLAEGAGFQGLKVTPGRRIAMGNSGFLVQVGVDGTATLNQLATFLSQFRRIALLHRVVQLKTESPSSQGDPRLRVSLLAEGICLRDAPDRSLLFPETRLKADFPQSAGQLTVESAAGFPKEPGFRVHIGPEYATVTKLEGTKWTVTRGLEGTVKQKHAAGTSVELAPITKSLASKQPEEFRSLVAGNPFAKPAPAKPYEPKIAPISTQTVIRGTPWKLKLSITGAAPESSSATFALGEKAPEGMKIDPATGEVSWTPPATLASGKMSVTVTAKHPDVEKPLSRSFDISVKDTNRAPKLASLPPQTVFLGRTVKFKAKATDDDPKTELKYSLGDKPPAGASVDARTGEVRWTPPESLEPGDYKLTIVAADNGAPPMTTTQTVTVSLQEDVAAETYLVASVTQDDQPEAWLFDRLNNRRMVLNRNSTFRIADISGRVREIRREYITVEQDGATTRLNLGDSLRTVKPLPPPDVTPAASPATADEPAIAEIPGE